MNDTTTTQGPRKRVLLVYTELLDYRLPVLSEFGKYYDLTVTHSGRLMTDGSAGFREIVLPRRRFWKLQFQAGLRPLIVSSQFDTVVYFMDIGWISTVWSFLFTPRTVRRVTWGLWRTGNILPDWIRLALAQMSDFNVFYSSAAASDFIACGISQDRVSVARNTVYITRPIRNEVTQRDAILIVGSLNARKENDVTIAAFLCVADRIPEHIRLVFVGDGPESIYLRDKAAKSAYSDRIEFHAACHDEDVLRGFYDRAICSVSFGQAGLSVLQSFAYGVPFITRENAVSGGEIENISNGLNGYICGVTQRDLEKILISLLTNPKKAEVMGRNALEYYSQNASVSNMLEGFVRAIE